MEKGSEVSFSTANEKGEFGDSNFGAEVVAEMTKAIEDALDTAKGRLADKQEENRRYVKKMAPSSVVHPVSSCSSRFGCY